MPQKEPTIIAGVYVLRAQIGRGGMAAVFRAGVDLDRFDYTTLYAYTQVHGETHLERRLKAEQLATTLRGKQLDLATIRTVLEAQEIPMPSAEVALKIAIGQQAPARFAGEWQNLLCLNHPNVIQVYGGGVYQNRPYYAMELLKNLVPAKVIRTRFTIAQKLDIVRQAASGLQYLHTLGLIHRDIKPDNLPTMETMPGEYQTKVCDLGLGKDLHADLGLTQSQTVMGSPSYMAPEQIADFGHVDHKADIYSLGATLYELVSGIRPYHDKTTVYEVIAAVTRGDPPIPVKKHAPEVPEAVAAIIECAMAFDAEARYARVADLAEDLATYLKEEAPDLLGSTTYAAADGAANTVAHLGEKRYLCEDLLAKGRKRPLRARRRSDRRAAQGASDSTTAGEEPTWKTWLRRPAVLAGAGGVLVLGLIIGLLMAFVGGGDDETDNKPPTTSPPQKVHKLPKEDPPPPPPPGPDIKALAKRLTAAASGCRLALAEESPKPLAKAAAEADAALAAFGKLSDEQRAPHREAEETLRQRRRELANRQLAEKAFTARVTALNELVREVKRTERPIPPQVLAAFLKRQTALGKDPQAIASVPAPRRQQKLIDPLAELQAELAAAKLASEPKVAGLLKRLDKLDASLAEATAFPDGFALVPIRKQAEAIAADFATIKTVAKRKVLAKRLAAIRKRIETLDAALSPVVCPFDAKQTVWKPRLEHLVDHRGWQEMGGKLVGDGALTLKLDLQQDATFSVHGRGVRGVRIGKAIVRWSGDEAVVTGAGKDRKLPAVRARGDDRVAVTRTEAGWAVRLNREVIALPDAEGKVEILGPAFVTRMEMTR